MKSKIRAAIGATLAAALTALAIVSCGGGGSSFAGIDRLGVSSGSISGFGSIFVNGVEWDTSGATITIDDAPGNESGLNIGDVVTVHGTLSASGTQGQADSVDFDNAVEGPIDSINLVGKSFVVLSQTVFVNADTEFDDSVPERDGDDQRTLGDLQVGDIVEVSGYHDSTGAVRATRIAIRSVAGNSEVKGEVSSLDTGALTFRIGGLVVNYAGAMLEDFGTDTLSNGDFVEARGSFAVNTLTATTVQLEDSQSGEVGDDNEVEGYITRFVSATNFDVAGVTVTTDGNTEFEGGTSADLALNVKVEVEGEVNASGVIVADKLEIRVQPDEANVVIIGDVDTVNTAAGTVTVAGMNVIIRVTGVTRLEDESSVGLASFSLADLSPGDHVAIRGADDLGTPGLNDAIATRLKREDPDDQIVLQGPVAANAADLSVLGVLIATDLAVFLNTDGSEMLEAEFFAAITGGGVVKATTFEPIVDNIFSADDVQIKGSDD